MANPPAAPHDIMHNEPLTNTKILKKECSIQNDLATPDPVILFINSKVSLENIGFLIYNRGIMRQSA